MSRKKAAEYFVVAWVKDWRLRTYLNVIADGGPRIEWDQAHTLFPWLPDAGLFIRNLSCRPYLAGANRPLSDALCDAGPSAADLLAFAPKIEAFTFKTHSSAYVEPVQKAAGRGRKKLALAKTFLPEAMDRVVRLNGHHWKVCK
jgi:hypothetical protein